MNSVIKFLLSSRNCSFFSVAMEARKNPMHSITRVLTSTYLTEFKILVRTGIRVS